MSAHGQATSGDPEAPIPVGVYGGTNNATVGYAIEHGVDYLYPAIHWYEGHDYLKSIVAQARDHGIKVIPSYGTGSDGYGDAHHAFAAEHPQWWEQRRDGSQTDSGSQVGLSFGVPEVRQFKVDTLTRRVKDYDLDGIMLDYTRMFDRNCGYHPSIVEAFQNQTGRNPYDIPNDDPAWIQFRADVVTGFVRELRSSLDALAQERGRPVEVWACVNPEPQERRSRVYQDWQAWVDRGLVDGVVTMVYERDTNNSIERVKIANAACAGKVPHIPMVSAWGGMLTSDAMVLDASLKVMRTGTDDVPGPAGVAFYRDDTIAEYGVWDAIGQVAAWTPTTIADMPINYALNPGFESGLERWAVGDGEGIEVTTDHAHSGDASLSLTRGTVRQLIDRGFMPNAKTLDVSLWIKSVDFSGKDRMFLDVNTNTNGLGETYYRVPLFADRATAQTESGWKKLEARVPVVDIDQLNWLIISLTNTGGRVLIDDFSIDFDDATGGENATLLPKGVAGGISKSRGNLALGQLVSASSFWEAGFEPDNAVDGDLSIEDYGRHAVWHSQRPAKDQWLQIFLPAPKRIARIRLLNASAQSAYRTRDYRIETSMDGRRFRPVAEGTLPDDGTTWIEVKVDNVPAKYIRFIGVNGYNRDYAVGLKEIEVYGN